MKRVKILRQRRLIPSTSMLMAFDASARNNSFTEAAQELNLTQGAISRQVNALEVQLGVKLFYRIKKSIRIAEKLMRGQGRILVRRSGTESKIRVMGESENKKLLQKCINIIKKKIR